MKYRKNGDIIEIQIGKHTVLIDAQDERLLEIFPSWIVRKDLHVNLVRYIPTEFGVVRQDIYLHRAIIKPSTAFDVDHKDRNPLNNCRSNIRYCSKSQNAVNRAKAKGKTSKYHGVSLAKKAKTNRWRIFMRTPEGKRITGCFRLETDAARAYDKIAKEIWGEFAPQNFPEDKK